MADIIPRYEFRTFAQTFGLVETKMRKIAPCEQIRESSEIYVVSASSIHSNTKIRDEKMDIKELIETRDGFERWNPRMKGAFPLSARTIREEVFPALGIDSPALIKSYYSLRSFIEDLVIPHASLRAVHVFKRRFAFTINRCIVEIADLLINGAAIQTVGVELEDTAAILAVKDELGLGEYENINYLRAIKRIVGLERYPDLDKLLN